MAGAVAILARLAPMKKLAKFLAKLRDYYGDGSDPTRSLLVAGVLKRLTQNGKDCLKELQKCYHDFKCNAAQTKVTNDGKALSNKAATQCNPVGDARIASVSRTQ